MFLRAPRIALSLVCVLFSCAASSQPGPSDTTQRVQSHAPINANGDPTIICYPMGCCYDIDTWEKIYCDA